MTLPLCGPKGERDTLSRLLRAHPFASLAPAHIDFENDHFQVRVAVRDMIRSLYISERDNNLEVYVDNPPETMAVIVIEALVRRMFRLDENLSAVPNGRVICSESPFEDLIKLVCASKLEWNQVVQVVGYLVGSVGHGVFPTPERLARVDTDFLEELLGSQHFGSDLRRLARLVASGQAASWSLTRDFSGFEDGEVVDQLRSVWCIAPWLIPDAMVLLGRYHHIFSPDGAPLDEQQRKKYRSFGHLAGLAYWVEHYAGRDLTNACI
ncbi:MAG: hypothetical protein NVSMB31_05400 [Vulcanimicrobiaceae bacterium]